MTNEDQLLAQANDTILKRRSETHQSELSDATGALDEVLGRIGQRIKAQESADGRIQYANSKPTDPNAEVKRRLTSLLKHIGRRYEHCALDNYDVKSEKQREVLGTVCTYVGRLEIQIASGNGLVLFGPPGTGKDHLLIGAAREAVSLGFAVLWCNAQDLFGALRDAIDADRPESKVLAEYTAPSVLVLSDPVPQFGRLTEYQANMLWRIIDRRYRDCKPTWMSLNVKSGGEAGEKLGTSLVDRLRDGATYAFCDWPSYRKVSDSPAR
jgi:DNA replication protein DnaC